MKVDESVAQAPPSAGAASRPRRPNLWRTLVMFFSVVGPGIITANADNDVGGITVYSLAGAQFGYTMLWLLIPVTVALIVTQEMCARMGAVTGKGLADLIRENFGVRITFWVLLVFVLGDLGNTAAEFAGIASAAPILQQYAPILSKYLLVPLAAIFVFTAVTRGNYKIVERIFFFFCFVYIAYVFSGFLAHPDWHEALSATIVPHFAPSKAYLLTAIGVIGTTISPWMQFYIQSSVVEKGVRLKEYPFSRIDVISGALVTDIIAYFIILASAATIFVFNQQHGSHPIAINDAGDVAHALAPLAGKYASLLFAIGLLNAAIFTASILPLSTAYYVCEAFGFESGLENRFRDAPIFYVFYLSLIAIGAGFVLVPNAPLLATIFYSQVLNGVLLPVVLVLMLILINQPRLMGTYTNNLAFNVIAWATVIVVGGLTLISTAQLIFPSLGS
ncbi:MAG: Nramp family divalent metal transporter [Candidatus Eremiobacteraeota bacterium]|nr:Nramp family divalent metal transporter [Candidatus Eremiobacteraeota bacterium]MBV8355840.1 Nramp family divalent metal transporter [Candidatus Eremiobacteraeota bacterium]